MPEKPYPVLTFHRHAFSMAVAPLMTPEDYERFLDRLEASVIYGVGYFRTKPNRHDAHLGAIDA